MFSAAKKKSFSKSQLKHTSFAALWLERHASACPNNSLANIEKEIVKIANTPQLSDAEQIAEILLKLHSEIHGQKNFSSKWPSPLVNFNFSQDSTLQKLNSHALRSVPLRAQRALLMWAAGKYPLVLLRHIPTPWELFLLQTEGKRALSLILKPKFLSHQFEERNYFEFILHDLIHADHFFENPERMNSQIGFCKLLKKASDLNLLYFLKEESFQKNYQGEFDYLISDMNSHCLHLALTLKSMLCRYWQEEEKFNQWWQHLMTAINRPELASILIKEHRDEKAMPLIHFFQNHST